MRSQIYQTVSEGLSKLIEDATHNASIFVPDLQRPYVWSPRQVSLLVDSIFRGWPFGSLLTWTVKPEIIDGRREGIPARAFYTFVNRVSADKSETATPRVGGYNTPDKMVLDGQQRLQSLILAFGDAKGICMCDSEWRKLAQPNKHYRANANHYTTGSLCLDFTRFLGEMQIKRRCRNVRLDDCLQWVVTDEKLCSIRHDNGDMPPLPRLNSTDGVFLPLKAIWAGIDATNCEKEDLDPIARNFVTGAFSDENKRDAFCKTYGGYDAVVEHVVELLRQCCAIKELKITCLNVEQYNELPRRTKEENKAAKQEYDDAIVNIFTRLNTAGRALTREEITFAWIKSTWKDAVAEKGNYPKAEDFISKIAAVFSDWGLSNDDYIRALSNIWCVQERGGKALGTQELLQADVIRGMSKFIRSNADALVAAAEVICDVYVNSPLHDVRDSFNGVTIAWNLQFAGERARARIMTGRKNMDCESSLKALRTVIKGFVTRWAVLPRWGGRWANQAVAFMEQTMTAMSAGVARIDQAKDEKSLYAELTALSALLNHNAEADAMQQVGMRLWERKVSLYRSRLQAWQGLNERRAKFRRLTFQIAANGKAALDVDHIVAYAYWEDRVKRAFADGSLSVDGAASTICKYPQDFIARERATDANAFENLVKTRTREFINSIGNCMILNAGYNISKRTQPLSEFMDKMFEFKADAPAQLKVDRGEWSDAMMLNDVLLNPQKHTIMEIANEINKRETAIYGELKRFITSHDPIIY